MVEITKDEARRYLLGQLRLNGFDYKNDRVGLSALIHDLRCIQIDPLSPIATSPDMVALARIEDYRCGDLFQLTPGLAFEHFAKERCLLPAYAFPFYRARAPEMRSRSLAERQKRVSKESIDAVYAEIAEHGPLTASKLTDLGSVAPLDWSGWKGTGKLAKMALEILWLQCRIVVSGRNGKEKIYNTPERALPEHASPSHGDYARWALQERVEAAGLLARNTGPHWSMLEDVRTSDLPDAMVAEGVFEEVVVENEKRRYLAPAGFRTRLFPEPDEHVRILGPLDPLIWDRTLTNHIFSFEYIWEVYKPAHTRRWGWYVCPILHRGHFVGRLEGRIIDDALVIQKIWQEPKKRIERRALDKALRRLARSRGVEKMTRPKTFLRNT